MSWRFTLSLYLHWQELNLNIATGVCKTPMNWLYNVSSNKGHLSLWYQVCSTAKRLTHISHFWLYLFLISLNVFTHLIPTSLFFFIYLFLFKRLISALWLLHSGAARRAFLSFNRSSFQYRWHGMKGPRNKKGERHKRKCNLNSKHSSVTRQWVAAMTGAQTLKDTFESLHATLGTWASTCCRNILLQAAAWEARGIHGAFLPTLITLIT